MKIVDEPIETIHVYMVPEEAKRPYTAVPLVCALLCLVGIAVLTLSSGQHPYYEQARLVVPAQVLPPQVFQTTQAIIPTGVHTYPATYAHGYLTFSNGSVIGQSVPAGFTIDGATTDEAVYVPAANADGFGVSTVSAHLVASGTNIAALSINEVIGSSLFVRNLSPFTGGHPAYSVHFVTKQDRVAAVTKARAIVAAQVFGLHYPCAETISGAVTVTWRCQFVTYKVPSYMHVIRVILQGKSLFVDVVYVARPAPWRVR